jgi:hypothetical protein
MKSFIAKLPTMYKAVAAFISLLVPFLTSVGAALADGMVTGSEWVTMATAFAAIVAGTKAVYQTTNQKSYKFRKGQL